MLEFKCYYLLHGGEGPRSKDFVTVLGTSNRLSAAEQAAEYFDDVEQRKDRCGDDPFDGCTQYIEVVGEDGKSSQHEVVCEVKRVYVAVIR